jgi:hypothetical protein
MTCRGIVASATRFRTGGFASLVRVVAAGLVESRRLRRQMLSSPRRPHERTFHGDTFVDDYEWLRAKDDPDVVAHLEAENGWTQAELAHLAPLRRRVFDEIKARTLETDLSVPTRQGGFWYYTRTVEGMQYPIHARAPAGGPGGDPARTGSDPAGWTPPEIFDNAIERHLPFNRDAVEQQAKETLAANLRGVLATMTPEDVNENRIKFAEELQNEAHDDMFKLGLTIDTIRIQNVSDEVGYLASVGRRKTAEVVRDAEIAEAQARAETAQRLGWLSTSADTPRPPRTATTE